MVDAERARLWRRLDEDLREFVDPAFGEHFLSEPRLIYEAVEPSAVTGDRLVRAARHGAYIWLSDGVVAVGENLSLQLLASAMPDVQGLWIRSATAVVGIDVLKDAPRLTELHIDVLRVEGSVDLRGLPRLRGVSGSGRVLAQLGLLSGGSIAMSISDPFPRSRIVVDAPVESLVLVNLGTGVQDPILRRPAALHELTIKGARNFSLTSLAACTELRNLDVWQCKDLTGFAALAGLDNLEKITIGGSSTSADWAELLHARARVVTFSPWSDQPSPEVRAEMLRRGWTVPSLHESGPEDYGPVRGEWDEEVDAYVLRIDVADFLDRVRDRGDVALRTGEDIEAEIARLVHALPPDVEGERVQFDSESDYVFAYIRFRADGTAVETTLLEWAGLERR